ncbi:MAG: YbdK family carboxylate-amine ligase [Solirubrobacterales bacterium]|nr:YbdK family carboxylate-amine ligase [Solirubrobacterales bacterium]
MSAEGEIDIQAGRALFEDGQDFTVGLEEEFALLDPQHLGLVPRYPELASAALEDPLLAESVSGELISSEIEIRSGRGESLADAIRRQNEYRRALFRLAGEHGVALGATGTHPWSPYLEQPIIDTEHYHRVEDGLKWVAWRNNTFSLHVHMGVRGADRAVRVCDRLRPVLPVLLAISANSPFLDGRDSGLASVRSQTFTRSFPRCGVPDPFGDWRNYADYIDLLVRTRSIVEYTQVWWSVRPHLSFGTVEVRICDAQNTAEDSDALAALVVACMAQAVLEVDADEDQAGLMPSRLIEENLWRAIRYGLDGSLLDFSDPARPEAYPATEAAARLLQWSEPARRELGIDVPLPISSGTQQQRRLLAEAGSLEQAYARIVNDTRDSYAAAGTAEEVTG